MDIEDALTRTTPSIVIVPDALTAGIEQALAKAIGSQAVPDEEREMMWRQLVAFFGQYGHILDFRVEPKG